MKRNLTILIIFIALFIGCNKESNLSRLAGNYFPIPDTGSYWKYVNSTNGDTISISIEEKDVYYEGRYSTAFNWNNNILYFWKDEGNVKKFLIKEKYFTGNIFRVEERWSALIKLPLVDGDRWEDNYSNTVNIFGDPFIINSTLKVAVEFVDKVSLSIGNYSECYKINYTRETYEYSNILGDTNYTETWNYFLTPGVGIIKFTDSSGEYFLVDFNFN